MDRYASAQQFGGQRASVGRQVIVVADGQIAAGIIVAIGLDDRPIIRSFGLFPGGKEDSGWNASMRLEHRACATERELEALVAAKEPPAWCWPPRI